MVFSWLSISSTFSVRSTWQGATRLLVTPTKVLQRNVDFSILEAVAVDGVTIHLKVPRQWMHLFHTAEASVLFAWYDCGILRFGCQHPKDSHGEDAFLMQDQSRIDRSSLDPAYRPIPDFFEPWAQGWASSEQSAGYGLVSQFDDLQEPWMEKTFDYDSHGDQSCMVKEGNVVSQPTAFRDCPTSSTSSRSTPEYAEFMEPWAYNYFVGDTESRQPRQHDFDDTFPEWFSPQGTKISTSAGNLHQSGPSSIRIDADSSKQLSLVSAVLQACRTSLSGFYHWLRSADADFVPGSSSLAVADSNNLQNPSCCAGTAGPLDTRKSSPTEIPGCCPSVGRCGTASPCNSAAAIYNIDMQGIPDGQIELQSKPPRDTRCFPWVQTCLSGIHHFSGLTWSKRSVTPCSSQSLRTTILPSPAIVFQGSSNAHTFGSSFNRHQHDFVKLYWDRAPEEKAQTSVPFIDMVDVRQFCHRHNIRYMIPPRVPNQVNSFSATKGNTLQELPMPASFSSSPGFLRADACHTDPLSDHSLGCAQNLGCMPPVQIHPERLNQNDPSGIRDAFIPPQLFRHTKTRHQTNIRHPFGSTKSFVTKGMTDRARNPMDRDSVPYDCRPNQSVTTTSSSSHLSSGDGRNDQIDIEITFNDSYPETASLPITINSAISRPSNSTFSQTDDELQVTDDCHQTMSKSAKLQSFTTLVLSDPTQFTLSSGAVPVDNLNFRQNFDDIDIRSRNPHLLPVHVEMLPGYNANLGEQLHCNTQVFPDHHHALRLIFDLCHSNAQFRYVPATTAAARTSNNFLPTTSPVLQHFTISSGAVPVNELNSMSTENDLLPSLTGSMLFVDQHGLDKYPSDKIQVSVHLLNPSIPNPPHLSLCGGALSGHIFQELCMDHYIDDQMYYIFDCRHKDVSVRYLQQHSANFWPTDKCRIQALLWAPPFSSAIRTSADRRYCQEEARATALALQQITISNGAVPNDNNLRHNIGLPGDLHAESIFPTVPNYVSKFEEKVYVSLPSRGRTHQLTLPRHRNNVVATPRLFLLKPDSCSTEELSWTHNTSSVSRSAGGFWEDDLCPIFSSPHFRGWSKAIYSGGHPAWGKCQVVHMNPNPPFAERCAAALQDEGWLASDEALWFLRKIQEWRSDVVVGPMIQWSPSRDLQHLMASEDQLQCTNHYLTLLLFLVEAHWCAVEVDRRTSPVHVVLIQWPEEHRSTITLEISRILQIPPHRMLVTVNSDNEIVTMCGWTILHRWYHNFALQTCLQPLIYVTEQYRDQLDRVTLRAQHHWGRTNASADLCRFATECRQAFLSEYARDRPDTRLPPGISTTMFVGPTQEYIREACQVPRPPTTREREINWLRTMLIQPAWLTNFELELVLQTVRLQMVDRYIPSPLSTLRFRIRAFGAVHG